MHKQTLYDISHTSIVTDSLYLKLGAARIYYLL